MDTRLVSETRLSAGYGFDFKILPVKNTGVASEIGVPGGTGLSSEIWVPGSTGYRAQFRN